MTGTVLSHSSVDTNAHFTISEFVKDADCHLKKDSELSLIIDKPEKVRPYNCFGVIINPIQVIYSSVEKAEEEKTYNLESLFHKVMNTICVVFKNDKDTHGIAKDLQFIAQHHYNMQKTQEILDDTRITHDLLRQQSILPFGKSKINLPTILNDFDEKLVEISKAVRVLQSNVRQEPSLFGGSGNSEFDRQDALHKLAKKHTFKKALSGRGSFYYCSNLLRVLNAHSNALSDLDNTLFVEMPASKSRVIGAYSSFAALARSKASEVLPAGSEIVCQRFRHILDKVQSTASTAVLEEGSLIALRPHLVPDGVSLDYVDGPKAGS